MNELMPRNIGPSDLDTYKFEPTQDRLESEWTKTAGGGGGEIEHPFQLLDASAGGVPMLNVRYGTMMDVVPNLVATDVVLSAGTATYYAYLKNNVDTFGSFLGSELIVDTSPQPSDTVDYGYITLGEARVGGVVLAARSQAATHSLRMSVCGRTFSAGTAVLAIGNYEFWGF